MNTKIKPELLSPAGDMERLEFAVKYGADAVYLGGKSFGMRANPENFTFEQLREAVKFAHNNNVKVYLTCNIVPHNDDIEQYKEYIETAYSCGVDAAIVSDIGILSLTKKYVPDLDVHISTQAGVTNYVTANELYNMGASRVVLARELSIDEIKKIRDNTPPGLDIEVFGHGAMCVSFSGRCLLSSYLTSRDANRGECAQPCRWGYYLVEEKRPNELYKVFEDERGSYILNAKDMCMLEHIDKLVSAGISSIKIEGRAKSLYYTAVVTNAYRCAIDNHLTNKENPQWLLDEVKKVSHREYCTGFFFGDGKNNQYYENAGYVRNFDIVGIVDKCQDGYLYITQRNKFSVGDEIELLESGKKPIQFIVDNMFNENGQSISDAAHALMKLKIKSDICVEPMSILRKQK